MIIHPQNLKKNKKNEISAALNREKRNHHKLSPNAKLANRARTLFIAFAMVAVFISLCLMSYNLMKPQIDKLHAEGNTDTEPANIEYKMIYKPETGKYEVELDSFKN